MRSPDDDGRALRAFLTALLAGRLSWLLIPKHPLGIDVAVALCVLALWLDPTAGALILAASMAAAAFVWPSLAADPVVLSLLVAAGAIVVVTTRRGGTDPAASSWSLRTSLSLGLVLVAAASTEIGPGAVPLVVAPLLGLHFALSIWRGPPSTPAVSVVPVLVTGVLAAAAAFVPRLLPGEVRGLLWPCLGLGLAVSSWSLTRAAGSDRSAGRPAQGAVRSGWATAHAAGATACMAVTVALAAWPRREGTGEILAAGLGAVLLSRCGLPGAGLVALASFFILPFQVVLAWHEAPWPGGILLALVGTSAGLAILAGTLDRLRSGPGSVRSLDPADARALARVSRRLAVTLSVAPAAAIMVPDLAVTLAILSGAAVFAVLSITSASSPATGSGTPARGIGLGLVAVVAHHVVLVHGAPEQMPLLTSAVNALLALSYRALEGRKAGGLALGAAARAHGVAAVLAATLDAALSLAGVGGGLAGQGGIGTAGAAALAGVPRAVLEAVVIASLRAVVGAGVCDASLVGLAVAYVGRGRGPGDLAWVLMVAAAMLALLGRSSRRATHGLLARVTLTAGIALGLAAPGSPGAVAATLIGTAALSIVTRGRRRGPWGTVVRASLGLALAQLDLALFRYGDDPTDSGRPCDVVAAFLPGALAPVAFLLLTAHGAGVLAAWSLLAPWTRRGRRRTAGRGAQRKPGPQGSPRRAAPRLGAQRTRGGGIPGPAAIGVAVLLVPAALDAFHGLLAGSGGPARLLAVAMLLAYVQAGRDLEGPERTLVGTLTIVFATLGLDSGAWQLLLSAGVAGEVRWRLMVVGRLALGLSLLRISRWPVPGVLVGPGVLGVAGAVMVTIAGMGAPLLIGIQPARAWWTSLSWIEVGLVGLVVGRRLEIAAFGVPGAVLAVAGVHRLAWEVARGQGGLASTLHVPGLALLELALAAGSGALLAHRRRLWATETATEGLRGSMVHTPPGPGQGVGRDAWELVLPSRLVVAGRDAAIAAARCLALAGISLSLVDPGRTAAGLALLAWALLVRWTERLAGATDAVREATGPRLWPSGAGEVLVVVASSGAVAHGLLAIAPAGPAWMTEVGILAICLTLLALGAFWRMAVTREVPARGSLEAGDWRPAVRPADSEPPDSRLRTPDLDGPVRRVREEAAALASTAAALASLALLWPGMAWPLAVRLTAVAMLIVVHLATGTRQGPAGEALLGRWAPALWQRVWPSCLLMAAVGPAAWALIAGGDGGIPSALLALGAALVGLTEGFGRLARSRSKRIADEPGPQGSPRPPAARLAARGTCGRDAPLAARVGEGTALARVVSARALNDVTAMARGIAAGLLVAPLLDHPSLDLATTATLSVAAALQRVLARSTRSDAVGWVALATGQLTVLHALFVWMDARGLGPWGLLWVEPATTLALAVGTLLIGRCTVVSPSHRARGRDVWHALAAVSATVSLLALPWNGADGAGVSRLLLLCAISAAMAVSNGRRAPGWMVGAWTAAALGGLVLAVHDAASHLAGPAGALAIAGLETMLALLLAGASAGLARRCDGLDGAGVLWTYLGGGVALWRDACTCIAGVLGLWCLAAGVGHGPWALALLVALRLGVPIRAADLMLMGGILSCVPTAVEVLIDSGVDLVDAWAADPLRTPGAATMVLVAAGGAWALGALFEAAAGLAGGTRAAPAPGVPRLLVGILDPADSSMYRRLARGLLLVMPALVLPAALASLSVLGVPGRHDTGAWVWVALAVLAHGVAARVTRSPAAQALNLAAVAVGLAWGVAGAVGGLREAIVHPWLALLFLVLASPTATAIRLEAHHWARALALVPLCAALALHAGALVALLAALGVVAIVHCAAERSTVWSHVALALGNAAADVAWWSQRPGDGQGPMTLAGMSLWWVACDPRLRWSRAERELVRASIVFALLYAPMAALTGPDRALGTLINLGSMSLLVVVVGLEERSRTMLATGVLVALVDLGAFVVHGADGSGQLPPWLMVVALSVVSGLLALSDEAWSAIRERIQRARRAIAGWD